MSITQGDNGLDILFFVSKTKGYENLTGAYVTVAVDKGDNQPVLKQAIILDPQSGKCSFTLTSDDLTKIGVYKYQWTVMFTDGRVYSGREIEFYVSETMIINSGGNSVGSFPFATPADLLLLQAQIDALKANGTGTSGGGDMPLVTVKDGFSGSGNITKTYTDSMVGFLLNNKGTSDITFVINNITVVVEAGAVWDDYLDPFTTVSITASTPYFVEVKGYIVGTPTTTVDTTPPVLTITPNGGTFATSQGVTLTTNENATIYYTTDGSVPTTLSSVYTGPITLNTTTTLKAYAVDSAGNACVIQTVTFTKDATAPSDTTPPVITASPNGGTFTVAQSVTLTANETATIYYTTDGTTPSTASSVYSSPIPIGATSTLKFFGVDIAGNISAVQTVSFTINIPDTTPPNPVTNLAAGTVTASSIPVSWTLSSSPDVANYEVAYSSDGGSTYTVASAVVNASSNLYTVNGLSASTAYLIRVVAMDGANNRSTPVTVSATTTAAADTTPPIVTASPAAGTYTSAQTVTLTANESATIYYTTDGTTPTYPVSGTTQTYSGSITISATTTLKYFGRDTAGNASAVQTATYTISASGSIVASDDFNRADGALGTAVTGQAWTTNNASIITNQLGFAANSTVVPNIDSGKSDNITIEMDLVMSALTPGNVSGISARIPSASGNQGINFGAKATGTKAGFTNTLSGVSAAPVDVNFTWVAGQIYHLKMVISGNVYTCYIDGNLIMTYTDTNSIGLTNTRHGIIMYNTTVPRADNFKISNN